MNLDIDQSKDFRIPRVEVKLTNYSSLTSETAIRSHEDAVKLIGEEMRSLDREYICIINALLSLLAHLILKYLI